MFADFDYDLRPAEKQFTDLMTTDDLDKNLRTNNSLANSAEEVKTTLKSALQRAFGGSQGPA